jgi:hypothetical protein
MKLILAIDENYNPVFLLKETMQISNIQETSVDEIVEKFAIELKELLKKN